MEAMLSLYAIEKGEIGNSRFSDKKSEVSSDFCPLPQVHAGPFPSHAHVLQPCQSCGALLVADDVLHDGRGQSNLAQLGREALDQLKK